MPMNVRLIEKWIAKNEPHGATKLAAAAEVSLGTVNKILKQEHSPGVDIAIRIAGVMDVTLDELCSSESNGPKSA